MSDPLADVIREIFAVTRSPDPIIGAVRAHLAAVLDAEEAEWEGADAEDIFGSLRARLLGVPR